MLVCCLGRSYTLKVEVVRSPETSVDFHCTKLHYIPEEISFQCTFFQSVPFLFILCKKYAKFTKIFVPNSVPEEFVAQILLLAHITLHMMPRVNLKKIRNYCMAYYKINYIPQPPFSTLKNEESGKEDTVSVCVCVCVCVCVGGGGQ
jgi:hypothetical protein